MAASSASVSPVPRTPRASQTPCSAPSWQHLGLEGATEPRGPGADAGPARAATSSVRRSDVGGRGSALLAGRQWTRPLPRRVSVFSLIMWAAGSHNLEEETGLEQQMTWTCRVTFTARAFMTFIKK